MLSEDSLKRAKPLYQQTYQALRSAILRGELPPGSRLVEHQLAKKLQVSRTPIREAMRTIQREGLAVVDAAGRLCVAELSSADITQLCACRIALEQVSVAEACRNATLIHLNDLKLVLAQIEQTNKDDFLGVDCSQLLKLNTRFHRLIAEASGNKWLILLLDQILEKIALFRVQILQSEPKAQDVYVEHCHIYDAIACRDIDAAVQAITTHLLNDQSRGLEFTPLADEK